VSALDPLLVRLIEVLAPWVLQIVQYVRGGSVKPRFYDQLPSELRSEIELARAEERARKRKGK